MRLTDHHQQQQQQPGSQMARLALHTGLLLLLHCVAGTTAALQLTQGRLSFADNSQVTFTVEGVATVELGGASQPIYYFDCSSTTNNGSGLVWTREGVARRFDFSYDASNNASRLNAADIGHSDLGVYSCIDRLDPDNTMVSINITNANPAVCAVEEVVGVVEGQTVQLEIYASSYPLLGSGQLTWYRPNGSAISGEDADIFDRGKRLVLSDIRAGDAGLYRCEAAFIFFGTTYLRDSDSIQLNVYVPPSITVQPVNATTVTEGEGLTLTCSASASPAPSISWERQGGTPLPVDATTPQSSSSAGTTVSVLTIPSTRYDDRGSYRCVGSHEHGETTIPAASQYTIISVLPSVSLTATQGSQSLSIDFTDLIVVSEGMLLTLECLGSGKLIWTSSNGLEISTNPSDGFYQQPDMLNGVQRLVFSNFSRELTAVYSCQTDITTPPVTTAVFITTSNPGVYIATDTQYVLQGTSTTLSATVIAHPAVGMVQWYHEGTLIDPATSSSYSMSSEGSVYSLTVVGVSGELLGSYQVVVTVTGGSGNASDTVLLAYPVFPSAAVSPEAATINEGDEVRFQCVPGGSGQLSVEWGLADGRRLSDRAEQNGNELVISDADKSHAGVYVCSVSNLAGTFTANVTLNVFHAPTAVITYGSLSTTSTQQPLALTFTHGDIMDQTVTCSSDGYLPPSISWEPSSLSAIPAGISQQTSVSGLELRWERAVEYMDSGTYDCVATNDNGTSSVQLELLVQFFPVINSLVSSSAVTHRPLTSMYLLPPGFSGHAVTCLAFGSPPPRVRWLKLDQTSLPPGIVSSENGDGSGMVSATLTWEREFEDSDAGDYFCLAESSDRTKSDTDTIVISSESDTTTDPTPVTCSVDASSVFFQIRVLATDCQQWSPEDKLRVATLFRDEIVEVITLGCGCDVQTENIAILSTECSAVIQNAVVFQGRVESASVTLTSSAYCALEAWQTSSPLVILDGDIHSVDAGCTLQIAASSSECPASPTSTPPSTTIVAIAASVAGAGAIVLLGIIFACCIGCYLRNTRQQKSNEVADSGEYSRTTLQVRQTRYTGHPTHFPPPPPPSLGEPPQHLYSSLQRHQPSSSSSHSAPLPPPPSESPEHIQMGPIRTASRDRLIGMDSIDSSAGGGNRRTSTPQQGGGGGGGGGRGAEAATTSGNGGVTPYQLPVSSMGSLAGLGQSLVQPRSKSASRLPSPPRFGVQNPMSAYEDVDHSSSSSERNSFTRKFSEGGRGGGGTMSPLSGTFPSSVGEKEHPAPTTSSSVVRQFRIASVASPTSTSSIAKMPLPPSSDRGSPTITSPRDSSCSEAPPPYSSIGLAPSNMTVDSIGASSMLENTAYERVNSGAEGEGSGDLREWYHNDSDLSINQTSRMEGYTRSSHQHLPQRGSRPDIQPYATIHNSAIPLIHTGGTTTTTTQARTSGGGGGGSHGDGYARLHANAMQRNVNRPQPYAEPVIKSSSDSLASFSHVQASANFETIVV